ncbi:MAG: nonstructural protein [Microviridae sp.]|nr:MAG: nonstructural protein [Microviridae sp.]
MIKYLYSIYDNKAKAFSNPFTSVNDHTAVRDFQRAATDPNSDICRFPEDYTLFQIASFNDENAVLDYKSQIVNLGIASSFKPILEG